LTSFGSPMLCKRLLLCFASVNALILKEDRPRRLTSRNVASRLHATSGGVFNEQFLATISKFYSPDTATELMGPLVYSLFRSMRPTTTVELGAGYTTFWLAKAAADAAREAVEQADAAASGEASWVLWNSAGGREVVEQAAEQGTYTGTGQSARRAERPYFPTVHTVDVFDSELGSHFGDAASFQTTIDDILGHAASGGGGGEDADDGGGSESSDDGGGAGVGSRASDGEVTSQRGCDVRLQVGDWASFREQWPEEEAIDFLWLDGFNRETFDLFWPLVRDDGGVAVLHSTLNNHKNWNFIQELKLRQATSDFCDFELVSLLEPHKWQQNSCTLLRKTTAYDPAEQLVRGRA